MPLVDTPKLTDQAWSWLYDYIALPHPQLGRKGAVCPFVQPALNAGSLRLEQWEVSHAASEEELGAMVDRMAEVVVQGQWGGSNPTLRSLVVVVAGLEPERHRLLDRVQNAAKPGLVSRGLMLGQFHADCDDRAVRNPDFRVSRAPLPMLALRYMAFHDVLFLHEDAQLFASYRERFGDRYTRGSVTDALFIDLFEAAAQRWADHKETR
ncbi:DUF6875 domain-containing protein [Streptomyces sp. NPDC101455]|uniref:DUF6875 domain-containing protein n=1 Tax=Streptomyces sp. NPDC101455 TaxID=3366142 RepID=UPI00380BF384